MIRSGVFTAGPVDTQKAIVAELLNNMKTKSYLPLLTYKFLTEGIDPVSVFHCFCKTKLIVFKMVFSFFLLARYCYVYRNNLALFKKLH